MKTIFALMLAGAFLTSPIARAGDEAPAAADGAKKKAKKSKPSKTDEAPAADKKEETPKAADKKADKGGW
jgi:hypothetical protein